MNLEPPSYACSAHDTDLTALVAEAVEEIGPPNAYPGFHRRGRPDPFTVIVSCPGDGASGSAHDLTCSGHFTS